MRMETLSLPLLMDIHRQADTYRERERERKPDTLKDLMKDLVSLCKAPAANSKYPGMTLQCLFVLLLSTGVERVWSQPACNRDREQLPGHLTEASWTKGSPIK